MESEGSPGTANRGVEQLWQQAPPPADGDREFALQAWKQTIDVQMHFNDICMKIRNLAITLLTAVVSFAAYTVKERMTLDLGAVDVPIGSIVAAGGLAGWLAFWAMDRHWYHVFLRAAGIHAGRIERRWSGVLPELLLSSQVSESSGRMLFGWQFDSARRLTAFYAVGAIVLVVTGVLVWKARVPPVQEPAAAPPPRAHVSSGSDLYSWQACRTPPVHEYRDVTPLA